MPWKLHRKTGSSNRTNRALDRPPVPWISHGEWRKISHTPLGVALLKAAYGREFSVPEAFNHILVDETIPYKVRKLLAKISGGG